MKSFVNRLLAIRLFVYSTLLVPTLRLLNPHQKFCSEFSWEMIWHRTKEIWCVLGQEFEREKTYFLRFLENESCCGEGNTNFVIPSFHPWRKQEKEISSQYYTRVNAVLDPRTLLKWVRERLSRENRGENSEFRSPQIVIKSTGRWTVGGQLCSWVRCSPRSCGSDYYRRSGAHIAKRLMTILDPDVRFR